MCSHAILLYKGMMIAYQQLDMTSHIEPRTFSLDSNSIGGGGVVILVLVWSAILCTGSRMSGHVSIWYTLSFG